MLLQQIDESHAVRFDEWQWKVSYGLPGHGGKDYWSKKAEEREQMEQERKDSNRRKSQKRFSWRRSKRRKTNNAGVDSPVTPRTPMIPE